MDDAQALELIDAHLDDQDITLEQAESLKVWLRENPEHADRAFHRLFLHAFLRQRLQYSALPAPTGLVLAEQSHNSALAPQLDFISDDASLDLNVKKNSRPQWPVWLLSGVICLIVAASWLAFRVVTSPGVAAPQLCVYEGFDYPATEPPPFLGDGSKWPTTGGLQGLAGGSGWAEPWQETAPKVSVLVADTAANAWRASDMRKFGPLGYADSQGRVLQSSGIQMRTAAGPVSTTRRRVNVTSFPALMTDEQGVGRDGAILWLSMLAQSFDGRGLGSFAFLQLGSEVAGFRLGKLASVPSGNWSASGVFEGTEANFRWSDVPSGEAVFLVARITFRPGAEEVDVWIDPSLEAEPSVKETSLHLSLPDFRFQELSVSSRYTTDFDEIRLGATFRDVAPIR
ncbi:hypothetical protein [Planctomicrobium piriforme]|uniref:Uncharacterized protein n=1 Tax=Planctomicrobium piriforme TaxID=1576369 RepID=A0A1I3HPU9_9PLAN|nr:hypothetical protein [Planctomicrobium piriforme]SFI37786.1 hypothetical protein SAMN05421753_108149 [Planctomicrobium piriforme]